MTNWREKVLSFFFSSRRRHTRLRRDWSSDVCSSDLGDDRRYDTDEQAGQEEKSPTQQHDRGDGAETACQDRKSVV